MKTKSVNEAVQITNSWIKNQVNNKLILIRSCENFGKFSGCLAGWLDTKLSDYGNIIKFVIRSLKGRKQAKFLSTEFCINFPIKSFHNIYISDLIRAKQTLQILTAFEDFNYKEDKDLREVFHGKYEGLFFDG